MTKKASPLTNLMTDEEIDEFREFEAEGAKAGGPAAAAAVAGFSLLRRVLNFAINVAIRRAKERNPAFDEARARAEIERAIAEVGDGRIWDWLVNGGFQAILEWITLIIGLFG